MKKNHKTQFNTPEGYFESFNERLMSRLKEEEEDINTDFLPKTDGFKVPKNYFEQLESKVLEETTQKKIKVIPLFSKQTYIAAASIAAIFVLGILLFNPSNNEISFDDLASTEIDAYFESNELGFTSYELAEYVKVEDLTFSNMTDDEIEEETLLEYLDENLEEIEDLNLDYDAFE